MSRATAFFLAVVLATSGVWGEYESAGCSDEGCGIPCYLRPAEDDCHYIEHATACDGGGASDLEQQIWFLNNSLVRLREKLIQKGVIPAGGTCRPLTYIDNGGVLYTDLLITPGVIGRYVCEEGYSLHGHGIYECAIDGVWLGNTTGETPVCERSLVVCDPLVAIPYGHVSYQTVDTTQIQPGDIVVYSCDPPYLLEGAEYRICVKNGTWSSDEPKCIEPSAVPSTNQSGKNVKSNRTAIAAGVTVGLVAGIILTVVVLLIAVKILKKRKKTIGGYLVLGDEQENTDGNREERTVLKEEVKRKSLASKSKASAGNDVETVHSSQ